MSSSEISPEQQANTTKLNQQQPTTSTDPEKIIVLFKNTGSAPVLKKNRWSVKPSSTIQDMVTFLRKQLKDKIDKNNSLFIYVDQSFAPSLDQTIQNLYDCFESDNKLILHYAITAAWG